MGGVSENCHLCVCSLDSLLTLSPLEFDKFLEERAKAAEMVPSLPSPPSGDPAPAAGSAVSAGKKSEDALFAV